MSLSLAATGASQESLRSAVRSAWTGLAAGCLHTLAGADHLAALTPLTFGRSYMKASLLGALWGFGHSTGQLMLGLLMVVLKDRFENLVPALSKWGDTTVGLTLLAIGALGLWETAAEARLAAAEKEQRPEGELALAGAGGVTVSSQEAASGQLDASGKGRTGLRWLWWTFITGIVYGLQPDSLFVIIPALALPTKLAAAAYILMFVFGTVAAMGGYTAVIGATSHAMKKTNSWLTARLSGAASLVAMALGASILAAGWGINLPFAFSLH